MEINDFSSLIEVGVTLNIACVAIEYVKSYTSVLCNQVFNLKYQIEEACKECIASITDETTIRNLPNANVNGNNTEVLKDRLISKRSTLIADINKKKIELEDRIKDVCEVKNISSICLWLSLFGMAGLFLMGFEDDTDNPGIHLYWTTLTILSLIFTVGGWLRGNKEKPFLKFIDYCSLRFSIFTFFGFAFLSFVIYFFAKGLIIVSTIIEGYWAEMLVLSMFLIYSNFVASSFAIWNKAKSGQNGIRKMKEDLMNQCKEFNKSVNSVQSIENVDAMLTTRTE